MNNTQTIESDVIAGRNPVLEALRTHRPIEKIFILHGVQGSAIEQVKFHARQNGIVCAEVSQQRIKELAQGVESQGVVALISSKEYVEVSDILNIAKAKGEKPFVIILDEIVDPQNLGAIIRTAECCGAHGIIIPKHNTASITSVVAKASAGAIEYVNIAKVTNLVTEMEFLKEQGLWIIGTVMDAEIGYTQEDYNHPVAIVIGSEGNGIRKLVKEHCDILVKIPLKGNIASLNASVAAALVMFEVMRSRK